jgi:hypothetical protein
MSQVDTPGRLPAWDQAAEGGPSLGIRTQLDHEWISLDSVVVSLFPSCGEAALTYAPMAMGKPFDVDENGEIIPSLWSELDDEEKTDRNSHRAATRSRGKMRRYMVHNRLTKMWVLTFRGAGLHGADGWVEANHQASLFVRRMRRSLFRDKPFPYLFSAEPHPDGHGWHINLMLRNVYIDKMQMQRLWGNGNVWYTDFTKDRQDWLGRSLGRAARSGASRSGARRAASYAAKYIGKDFDQGDEIPLGAHRYEVAEGFQPPVLKLRVRSFGAGLDYVRRHPSFGAECWHGTSDDWEGWDGPPCQVLFFDAPAGRGSKRGPPSRAR